MQTAKSVMVLTRTICDDDDQIMDPVTVTASSDYDYDGGAGGGDISWILTSTALVFLMIPGVGFFYGGMVQSKNALSLIMLSCWSAAIVSIQWFLYGYSLTFSSTANPFIGNFDNVFLRGVLESQSDKIPGLAFCVYQAMFAAISPALIVGGGAERARFFPTLVFMFLWTTFVYDFIACWTWNPAGWSNRMGGLDFAGGSPVHISTASAAFAYAIVLGPREGWPEVEETPHNMSNVVLGTVLLWFGWFGFNGGAALASNTRAVLACVSTTLAASVGGIVWTAIDYFRLGRGHHKFSPLGFCSGVVAGLVTITPASGYVSPASSLAFGLVGATLCNLAMNLKHFLRCYDDALDVLALHGVGGVVGNILCGVFAQKEMAALDGQEIEGGWLNGNWVQVPIQIADSLAAFTWSFVVSYVILYCMNRISFLRLRVDIVVERLGLDSAEFGISCYEHVEDVRLSALSADANLTCRNHYYNYNYRRMFRPNCIADNADFEENKRADRVVSLRF